MSKQPQEMPLSKQELAARTDALWREELEWVRQHPAPDLTVFNTLVEKEKCKSNVGELPPLDIAMWPDDVFCDIDVSNPEKFNNRFIELPTGCRASGFEKFFWGFHNGMVLFLVTHLLFTDGDLFDLVFLYLLTLMFFGPLIYFFTFRVGREKAGRTRYNRQAQLVHIDNGKGHVAHIPWRHVRALRDIGLSPSSLLRICAPRPHADSEEFDLRAPPTPSSPNADDLRGLYSIGITLDTLDHASTRSNLQRLEFMRRYMEHGLQAIQPHQDAIAQGLVEDPEQFDDPKRIRSAGWDGKYLLYPIDRAWHYLSLGPWLDKRARRSIEGFEWNDEVKNLCGPNPDLRGLNTRPVKSRTDVYYRPDGASYRLVDRWGNPLRFEPAEQA